MKRKIASLTLFILVLSLNAVAANTSFQAVCSNATLKGAYGIYRSGTTPEGPIASVGIVVYDGNGQLKSRQKTSLNGVHSSSALTLDYKVANDCTYKAFSGNTEFATGVVVDNGNRIFLLSKAPGHTSYSVLEKIQK